MIQRDTHWLIDFNEIEIHIEITILFQLIISELIPCARWWWKLLMYPYALVPFDDLKTPFASATTVGRWLIAIGKVLAHPLTPIVTLLTALATTLWKGKAIRGEGGGVGGRKKEEERRNDNVELWKRDLLLD